MSTDTTRVDLPTATSGPPSHEPRHAFGPSPVARSWATAPEGHPPVADDPEIRRGQGGKRPEDVLPVVGALVASLSLTAAVYFTFAPFTGVLGYAALAYVTFLGIFALLVSMDDDAQVVKDRIAHVLAASVGAFMLAALALVVVFALVEGRRALGHWNFYTTDMSRALPTDPLTVGGIVHGAAGTLVMMALSLAMTIPLAIVCAVFLSETRGVFTRFVRTIVEAMTALPSVVAGLFIYATIVTAAGEPSGLAAAVALSVMMLPIMIRAADVVLRLVPGNLKEAAAALGASRWRVVWHVVLPTARSGLMTAIILGTARGIGETSPVLLTAGYGTGFNLNPFHDPMVSLPLLTFKLTRSPEPGFIARGFGAATVLMVLVLVLFVAARVIGGRSAGDLSRGQQRRRARQSRADLARFQPRDHVAGHPVAGPPAADPSPSSAPDPFEESR